MRKAALLYNPDSGGSKQRQRELQSAVKILREGKVEVDLLPTHSALHAGEETRKAVARGCDTIFACGGDGTIHNIVQVLANTSVVLAVLPMGTANALAHDLGLPLSIPRAAKAALHGIPRRVALGRVQYADFSGRPGARYFIITAGVGVDAHLFYKLNTGTKQRMGMTAYYAKAWHMWWTYPMTRFEASYVETGSTEIKRAEVTELMSVRIRNFGGVVRELVPGASLDRDDMRLALCRTSSRWAYLSYVTRGVLGLPRRVRGIDLVFGTKVTCRYLLALAGQDQRKVYVEADGELLGTLPAEMTIIPDALTVLGPAR